MSCCYLKLEQLVQQAIMKRGSRQVILIRHGETAQNKVGQISGWTDHRLSIKGREQANTLYQSLYKSIPQFQGIYSSDLRRAKDTCNISLGFPPSITTDNRLRELNFGLHDNEYFSTLPKEQQEAMMTMDYVAPEGEGWKQVKERAIHFFRDKCKNQGTYLLYTHGGVICTLTYELGFKDVVSNCSAVGLELDQDSFEPKDINFHWTYPKPEDIYI